MKNGTVIYLNGVTSSGKTSIVEALRSEGLDFYYLSDDVFEDNIIHIEYDAPGYWEALAEAVLNLETKIQNVLLLYYFLGFDHQEIAEICGCSVRTVIRRKQAALNTLREELVTGNE